jgi:zinc protease
MQTKAQSTADALVASLDILKELQENSPSVEEIEVVQRSIQSSFIFRYDSPSKAATRYALIKLLGYPPDYDERYLERIFAVDNNQVQEVAQKRWRMDDFVVVVVGNEKAYNLLEATLQNPPDVLRDYELINGSFYEKFARS